MLNEAHIIARLKTAFPDYIGDDAALIPFSKDKHYVITKDVLVEEIHFRPSYFDPSSLAHKALQANLSDLAAMGAKPAFILCGISIPIIHEQYATNFLNYFTQHCKTSNVLLIGGDTVKSPDKLFISITAIGVASNQNIKYRSTAKIGDVICVAGDLGKAHVGFIASEQARVGFEDCKNAFLRPQAKIEEGQWLGSQKTVTSMMDISDGLFIDLKRLCEASKLQGHLQLERVQLCTFFTSQCNALKLDALHTCLTGGEDYSLLFTIRENHFKQLSIDFMEKFGYPLQSIGYTSKGSGVYFTENGTSKTLDLHPFSHFGESI